MTKYNSGCHSGQLWPMPVRPMPFCSDVAVRRHVGATANAAKQQYGAHPYAGAKEAASIMMLMIVDGNK